MRSKPEGKLRDYAYSVADSFLYPLLFLASTPFFINRLGERYFGIWMLANTVFITLQIFNFGIGSSTLRYVSAYKAGEDTYKLNAVISINLKFSALLFALCVMSAGVIGLLIRHNGFLNIEPAMTNATASAVYLTGVLVGFKFTEQVFLNVFKSFRRFDLNFYASSGSRCLTLLINVIQAYYGTDIYRLFLSNIIVSALFLAIEYYFLKKIWPAFVFGNTRDVAVRRSLFSFGLLNWLQSAFMVLAFQADKFVVISVFGIERFGYYSILATIVSQLQMGLNSIVSVYVPGFIAAFHHSDEPGLARQFLRSRLIVYTLHSGGLMLFYLLGSTVFGLWFGTEKAGHLLGLLDNFIVLAAVGYLNLAAYAYLNACGHERQATVFTLIMGCASMLAVCLGGFVYHSIAVILTLNAAAIGICNILVEFYTNRLALKSRSFSVSAKTVTGILSLVSLIVFRAFAIKAIALIYLIFISGWLLAENRKRISS